MILVDTSVLLDYLKGASNPPVSAFDLVVGKGIPYGINVFIYQEILQGARTTEEYEILKEYFSTLAFYNLNHGKESYEKAAKLNIHCRQSGVTVRSTIDLLIVQTAIENDLFLLHNDKDFDNIAKVVPDLKLYAFS